MFKDESTSSNFSKRDNSDSGRKGQYPQVCIEGRFYFKDTLANCGPYILYKGVDVERVQWVHIYAKKVLP
jgi:hypothetical protein